MTEYKVIPGNLLLAYVARWRPQPLGAVVIVMTLDVYIVTAHPTPAHGSTSGTKIWTFN